MGYRGGKGGKGGARAGRTTRASCPPSPAFGFSAALARHIMPMRPVSLTYTGTVGVSIQDVFDLISDPSRMAEWLPNCVSVVPGPIGKGKDRKSTRLNSSHGYISYAVFCLKKKTRTNRTRASRCGVPNPSWQYDAMVGT